MPPAANDVPPPQIQPSLPPGGQNGTDIKVHVGTLEHRREAAHTSQTHAGKRFWRPGAGHAEGPLIPALESSPHLLAHLAATPKIYSYNKLVIERAERGFMSGEFAITQHDSTKSRKIMRNNARNANRRPTAGASIFSLGGSGEFKPTVPEGEGDS